MGSDGVAGAGERMSGQESQTNLVGRSLVGRYRLVSLLGAGGMGSVYKAHDKAMSERVIAVKVLAPHLVSDEKQVQRFEQEARAANQLRHPNTISVLDFGRDPDGHIFMVIEYLTGETLTGILRHGRISVGRVLYIFRQICKSLAEAHSKGIVHRDLKPDNIFVCEIYGESDFVKVIDFGIAKFLEEEGNQLTQAGKMFGTPRYLSPEQAQGKRLDARSDLYSLGVMLFECIAGRPPFVAEEAIAVAIKHVQEKPPRMEEVAPDVSVPREVDRIVFKLLSKRPEDRFQTAEEVVAAIDEALAALQRSGRGLPVGQYTPHAALTPARPKTIPPASIGNHDEEATRALDALSELGGDNGDEATRAFSTLPERESEADATRAMDIASPGPAVGGEATVALDTLGSDAASLLKPSGGGRSAGRPATGATGRSGGGASGVRVAAAVQPAAAPASGSGTQRLVLLLIVAVLVVGAVIAATQLGGSSQAAPTGPVVTAAEAGRQAQEAARIAAEEAARIAAKEATEATQLEAERRNKAAQPKIHYLELHSTPIGADVLLDNLVLGKTPHKVAVSVSDPDRQYVLRLAGHEDYTVSVKAKTVIDARIDRLPAELKPKEAPKPVVKQAPGPAKPKAKPDWGF